MNEKSREDLSVKCQVSYNNTYCTSRCAFRVGSERGMAMVLTLLVLALLTALIVEFSYGVYTSSESLSNWKEAQRLSFAASSGVSLAVKTISDTEPFYSYTYPAKIDIPIMSMMDGFGGSVMISAEDENGRFNLNSLVEPNDLVNKKSYDSFLILLKKLELKETLAERIVDWIDRNSEPRLSDSEDGAKNGYMDSIDELILLHDMDSQDYERLMPYVTVFALDSSVPELININTASIPVIMSLDERITEELAQRVVDYRDLTPFEKTSDIVKVAGYEGPLGQSFLGRIAVKATHYRITSVAEENGMTRMVESVIESNGTRVKIKYWRED